VSLKAIVPAGVPAPAGPYSPGIDAGNVVFLAGQTGRNPETGKLEAGLAAQTEQVMTNLSAVLEAAGLTWANVAKTTCLLADIDDFAAFNEVYVRFVSDPKPARATYAVKDLPGGALVEVEAFAVRD
jgi:2-iminobutanoate/2-iminopropanoate deaminase